MGDKSKAKSRKPANSAFKQQRLAAWQPILTPKPVIATFAAIGLIFVGLGIFFLITTLGVYETAEIRYDDQCNEGSSCTIEIEIEEDMSSPVYMYYKLESFYQNHRRYVKSRSDKQLLGISTGGSAECDPLSTIWDLNDEDKPEGADEEGGELLPCGLIAGSFFNDTFILRRPNDGDDANKIVPWKKEGIAWESDLEHKFGNPPGDYPGVRLISDFTDEDFVVWMRVAGLPAFRKLHRIIDEDLPAGTYTLEIQNNYPWGKWDEDDEYPGKKMVVLSETSWLGGRNIFLGVAYIVVGGLCIILGIAFTLLHILKPRKMGDVTYLDWNR